MVGRRWVRRRKKRNEIVVVFVVVFGGWFDGVGGMFDVMDIRLWGCLFSMESCWICGFVVDIIELVFDYIPSRLLCGLYRRRWLFLEIYVMYS